MNTIKTYLKLTLLVTLCAVAQPTFGAWRLGLVNDTPFTASVWVRYRNRTAYDHRVISPYDNKSIPLTDHFVVGEIEVILSPVIGNSRQNIYLPIQSDINGSNFSAQIIPDRNARVGYVLRKHSNR